MSKRTRSRAPMALQPLEARKLFSGACELPTDAPVEASSARVHEALALTTLATSPYVKIKGNYKGSIVSNTFGGINFELSISIPKFTHTGHFTGTAVFKVFGQEYSGNFSGRITTKRHIVITFDGNGISGGLDGKASHTGGSFKGNYSVSGSFNDSGTFTVAKP